MPITSDELSRIVDGRRLIGLSSVTPAEAFIFFMAAGSIDRAINYVPPASVSGHSSSVVRLQRSPGVRRGLMNAFEDVADRVGAGSGLGPAIYS